jgi:hypothetical protein
MLVIFPKSHDVGIQVDGLGKGVPFTRRQGHMVEPPAMGVED